MVYTSLVNLEIRCSGGDFKMKTNIMTTGLSSAMVLLSLTGCDKIADAAEKIAAAVEGGPQTSYCESLCDWAVDCAGDETSLSADEMMSRCSDATHEVDEVCADAEAGTMEATDVLINNECVAKVEVMSCDGLVGGKVDVIAGRPPEATCIGAYGVLATGDPEDAYHTYNAARNAVLVTGDELCQDVTVGLCSGLIGCGPELSDDLADEAMDRCMAAMSGFNDSCKTEGLYDQDLPIDYNINRGYAVSCVDALAESDSICSPSSWIDIASCAGAFVDPLSGTSLLDTLMGGASSYLEE
jgi:hypothetical protein